VFGAVNVNGPQIAYVKGEQMLNLSTIPVVDNHCHPVLLRQQMDVRQFRSYFTEATDPSFAESHVQHSVYYLWMLRQMADVYGCPRTEEAVLAAHNSMSADKLIERLFRAANIWTIILDPAYPSPDECYSEEQMGDAGHCFTERMLRLETLMERLIVKYGDFDEMVAHFSEEVRNLRTRGYCALKSIVAYRTGLQVAEWRKDQALIAFREAREEAVQAGVLRIAHKPLIDYLLHIAFQKAAEQQVPIQFHTGYGDSDTDMRLGNPLHLRDVLERSEYRTMPVVLLHESYPYSQLGAYLAAVYPQVYFDLSYTIPFVDALEMRSFTRQALGVAPASKLMFSTDGIHVPEMHCVGAIRGRQILAQVLQEMIEADELDEAQAYTLAQLILHDTACRVYRLEQCL
jgi:predicted TIM-barrel fold metal-dependent hydrolase